MADSGSGPGELISGIRAAGVALRGRSVMSLVERLGTVGSRFLDPDDPIRAEAESRVPDDAGVSPPMAREIIEGMARDWTPERLEGLVRSDFPDPGALDGPVLGPAGDRWMAVGDDFAFHVASGSVPGVGATSLLRSLLVKTPLLLKPGRGDRVLPELLARAIAESDAELGAAVVVRYWKGGDGGALEAAALAEADRVVVYGANETVDQLRQRVRRGVPVVGYPHRVSVGIVAADVLARRGEELAEDAAWAAAIFDQRGCVSPHVIWVEGEADRAVEWASELARASARLADRLPPGPLGPGEASRIQQRRGSLELRAAMAPEGGRVWRGDDLAWTVAVDPDPEFPPSCLGRTLVVSPTGSLQTLAARLGQHRELLQSVALEVEGSRRMELAEVLARHGVTRMTTFRRQPWPPAWWKHDGRGPLEVLVRRVSFEE